VLTNLLQTRKLLWKCTVSGWRFLCFYVDCPSHVVNLGTVIGWHHHTWIDKLLIAKVQIMFNTYKLFVVMLYSERCWWYVQSC